MSDEERQTLLASRNKALAAFALQAWDDCNAALEAVRPLAQRHWGHATFLWYLSQGHCNFKRQDQPELLRSPESLTLWLSAQAFAAAAPPGHERDPRLTTLSHWYHWRRVVQLGDELAGAKLEQAWVNPRLELVYGTAASAAPEGGVAALSTAQPALFAAAELAVWANMFYGSREQINNARQWHATLKTRLGAAHRLTLEVQRSLAFSSRQLGRADEALGHAEAAASLALKYHSQDEALQMRMAGERAGCLATVGRLVEAREELLRLRGLLQNALPQDRALMSVNHNLAQISLSLGDLDAGIEYAEASLAHGQRLPIADERVQANIAHLWRAEARLMRGDAGAAEELQAALTLNTHFGTSSGAPSYSLARHAARSGDADQLAWAADFLARFTDQHLDPIHPDRALLPLVRAWQAGAPVAGSSTTPGLGATASDPAALAAVTGSLARALTLSLSGRGLAVEAQTHFALALLLAPQRPEQAVWLYKRGANALQRLRARLGTADDSLQRAWLADHEADLRAFIGLLIDQGRLLEAQQAMAFLRSEELHEYTRRSRRSLAAVPAALSYTPAEAQQNAQLEPLTAAIAQATTGADARADARPEWGARTRSTDTELAALLESGARTVQRLLGDSASAFASPASPASAAAAATPAAAKEAALQSALLAKGHARLLTFVRADGIDLLLQRRQGITRSRVAVPAVELNRAVFALRVALAQPGADALAPAQRLHGWLLAPLAAQLRGIHRLHIDADGALRQVPFAALHDGQQFAAERLELVMLLAGAPPAAAAANKTESRNLGAAPGPRTSRGLGLLAAGRTLPDTDHAALPGVADELAALARLRAPTVTTLQDAGFTRDALRSGLARQPAVVHLASHFVLDPAGEASSYLLLGDGSRLPLSQLGDMPWKGVRLALLSACDSGVPLPVNDALLGVSGQRGGAPAPAADANTAAAAPQAATATATATAAAAGRQVAGFASALQRAGVAEVLATLWPISDGATAQWMAVFYAPWQQAGVGGLPNPGWLARTQREWLRRHRGTALAHPHYWAAFTWMGL